jgi:ABC-type nickel/cobalt efflux system permease component RcnA
MFDLIALQANLHRGALDALKALHAGEFGQVPALMALAFGFGLVHALLPGHGKLVLASHYAVRGGWRDAILASIIVILTHVGSAILIVLSGAAILNRTLAGAGRAPKLETLSHALVVLVGLWLLYRAWRGHQHADDTGAHRSGPLLAFVAGPIPCPLTTFIMTYAIINGAVGAGLILSGAFAAGMIVTVAMFPAIAVLMRKRGVPLLAGSTRWQAVAGKGLEFIAALAIIALGALPLLR